MESPLHLKVHGGFGEGNGETRLSKGWKVRPVPTPRSGSEGGDSLTDHNFIKRYISFTGIAFTSSKPKSALCRR
jgi:hypothetical protein